VEQALEEHSVLPRLCYNCCPMFGKKDDKDQGDIDANASEEDASFAPDEELGDLGALHAKLKKMRLELANCKAERTQFLDGWQRAKADSINIRKDAVAEGLRARNRTRDALVHDIIPALDSFDMAVAAESWSKVDENWRRGMENVRAQLLEALKKSGIQSYAEIGDKFDPALHEIVSEMDDNKMEAGTISSVVRRGYRCGEEILRPAHVVIVGREK